MRVHPQRVYSHCGKGCYAVAGWCNLSGGVLPFTLLLGNNAIVKNCLFTLTSPVLACHEKNYVDFVEPFKNENIVLPLAATCPQGIRTDGICIPFGIQQQGNAALIVCTYIIPNLAHFAVDHQHWPIGRAGRNSRSAHTVCPRILVTIDVGHIHHILPLFFQANHAPAAT